MFSSSLADPPRIKDVLPGSLKGKNVLVIGNQICGYAYEIQKSGGTPYACSSKPIIDYAVREKVLDSDKGFYGGPQDLPDDLVRRFHAIVALDYGIAPFAPDFSDKFSAICKGLAKFAIGATVYMGINIIQHLEEPTFSKIVKIVQEHFGDVSIIDMKHGGGLLICAEPGKMSQQSLVAPRKKQEMEMIQYSMKLQKLKESLIRLREEHGRSSQQEDVATHSSRIIASGHNATALEESRNTVETFLERFLKEEQKENDTEDQLPKR